MTYTNLQHRVCIISAAAMEFISVVCRLFELFTKMIILSTAAKCNQHGKINVFGRSERKTTLSRFIITFLCSIISFEAVWILFLCHKNFTLWWKLVDLLSKRICSFVLCLPAISLVWFSWQLTIFRRANAALQTEFSENSDCNSTTSTTGVSAKNLFRATSHEN